MHGPRRCALPIDPAVAVSVQQRLRPALATMSAYQVANAEGMVKLDAMENPYGLPDTLLDAWAATLKSIAINRYPDPAATQLKQRMRERLALPVGGLLLGNGSDELIQMLAVAFGGEGRTFMSVAPSFVMYRLIAMMNGIAYHEAALKPTDFSLDMKKTIAAIHAHQPSVVFIANPNNPTGNLHPLAALRELAAVCPGLLVIDEAYAPFTDVTAMPLLAEFGNVLIMRTLSKMGLAGLRLGYLCGNSDCIDPLDKVRLPYNINVLTQAAVQFALDNKAIFDTQATRIRHDRQLLTQRLAAITAVTPWPSDANFILFRVAGHDATEVYQSLKDRAILIKNLNATHPALHQCLRVTVGTAEENTAFITALADILK